MQVRGALLQVRSAFLQQRCSAGQRERVMASLRPETRRVVDATPDAQAWFPFAVLVDLTRVIDRECGAGDLAVAREVGRFAAEVALASVRDSLVAAGSPAFLFRQAPGIWHQHYDTGAISGRLLTAESGYLRVDGFDAPQREHCASVQGWIERTLELTGMQDVVVEHRCRLDGATGCQYDCRWRQPPPPLQT